ncbi:unnamed protein product [Tenebrio molitor]|nr:unnamed protein product [Tenebrio molitor]
MLSIRFCIVFVAIPLCATAQNPILVQYYQSHVAQIRESLRVENISQDCSRQIDLYVTGLENREFWAWQMFDANTKFPSGLLAGNFYDLGNFDECLNVTSTEVLGKYCLGTIPVDPNGLATAKLGLTKGGQVRMLGNDPQFSGLHFAACIPHKCTAEDATRTYLLTTFDEKYCYSKETQPKLDGGAIATITILSVFLLLVILSTSYDLYLYYKGFKPGSDITVAFSFFTNGRKLIKSTTNPEQMLCLNGMKAISMMWIVMAHEYVNGSWGAVANYLIISEFIQERANMFVVGATIAVDTFFVIGGLVTVYTFLKATDKGVKFNIVLYYIHRYLRLTPAVAIVILIHATLLKHLGDGPLWSSIDDHLVESCRKHWWAALLYIQNYVHDEQACVPQTWYLSIDMQLFILSPLVLLPLKRKPKWTLIGLVVLVIAGIVVPFAVAFHQELTAFLFGDKDNVEKYMFSYYEQTYGRFGAYVIGMILGYLIYKFKKNDVEIKFKWFTTLSLWIICLAGGLACVYAGHGTMVSEYNKWSHSLYIAFNRPAWALAISGIIFLCVAGYGGPVNVFLSAPVFQFLSKISYAIYLVHYELILVRAASYKTEIMIEHFYVFFNFWGDFMFSVALAILLCLTFESPMITIEKLLFNRVVDSSSRIPSGIARGNVVPMGNYDDTIFALFGAITLVSTLYDIYLNYRDLKPRFPVMIAFSMYTNGKKLFRLGNSQQLECLNGIKALSMLWVVLGHVYMAYVFVPLDNYIDVYNWLDSTSSQYIAGATVSVDTFLVIGGFLTVYTFQATMDKGVKFNVPLYYFHRYLRLTPALAAMLLAHAALFNYFGSGPLWQNTDAYLSKACRKYWWSTLLYVQNYANPDGTCIPQSWYLSVDMQLFLVSPIILVLMRQWPIWGYILLTILSVLSMVASFLIGWFFELDGQLSGNISGNITDYMEYYYMPTHTRMVPYLIGVMLGYAIYKMKTSGKTPKINTIVVILGWILSLGVMAACIYGGHTLQFTEYDKLANSFYISLMRPAWAIAICWVIFACVTDHGGPINQFLSLPIFQILSRLSYSIYLVHYSFIFMTNFYTRSSLHFSDYNAFHKFWGDLAFSLAIAVVWTLVFESPIIVLEKVLLKKGGESKGDKKSALV